MSSFLVDVCLSSNKSSTFLLETQTLHQPLSHIPRHDSKIQQSLLIISWQHSLQRPKYHHHPRHFRPHIHILPRLLQALNHTKQFLQDKETADRRKARWGTSSYLLTCVERWVDDQEGIGCSWWVWEWLSACLVEALEVADCGGETGA